MGRYEFLKKLKEALENDLDHQKVQEHISYYTQYINEELRKGRTEEEIIEELGDPWMISRTIVDSPNGQEETYDQGQNSSYNSHQEEKGVSFGKEQPAWKKWLIMIVAVLFLFVILSAVVGIFRRLLPFLIPVIVVIIIIKMFKN